MKPPSSMGMNRTGVDMSPDLVEEMIRGTQAVAMGREATTTKTLSDYRSAYLQDAEPIGTVPMPGTLKGAAKAGVQKLMGRHAEVLIDKLGARLAFERTGIRLYDALLAKCMIRTDEAGDVPLDDLRQFRDAEARHMALVWDAMRELGADPTAVTPMADTNAVASIGLMQIISDPRMSVSQSIHAIHVAELADHDGWELLIKLAGQLGQDDMADRFKSALTEEERHLTTIRRLAERICLTEAGV